MATLKQIEANRINAQQSTGPRTGQGKSLASRNALKFGIHAASEIIRNEDPAALQALSDAYFSRWNPATPEEVLQVKILIRADWEDDRLARGEAQLWEHAIQQVTELDETRGLGQSFTLAEKTLSALGRRQDAVRRTFQKALRTLQDLRKLPAPHPQPVESEVSTEELGSFCQTPPEPDPPPVEPSASDISPVTQSPAAAAPATETPAPGLACAPEDPATPGSDPETPTPGLACAPEHPATP
ncbi:MAG TPA: hypothetical protein VGH38_35585, partial [Bryobacteraceae bacterium]